MPDSPVRVAVTGAAGQIGYALLFRIASGAAFGPETRVTLQLLELPAALPRLGWRAHGARGLRLSAARRDRVHAPRPMRRSPARTGPCWSARSPAGRAWSARTSSSINGGIFTGQGEAIARNASDDCRVLVVGNPCNTNALIGSTAAARHGMPTDRWFAMTMLDEKRARSQLAARAGVAAREVRDLAHLGQPLVDPVPRRLARAPSAGGPRPT